MKRRIFFLLPAFAIAFRPDALAWRAGDHRRIAALAIEDCPEALASFLRDNLDEVLRGSTDPDRRFLDTENHTYGVDDGTRNNPGHVAALSASLMGMMRNGAPREEVAYWFGALSHYVSDIDQPLHTSERDRGEIWYHPLFEELDRGFEAHGTVLGIGIEVKIGDALDGWRFRRHGPRPRIDDIRSWQIGNARWANAYYDEIGRIFAQKGPIFAIGDRRLAEIFRTCTDEAVEDVIDLWTHLYESAGADLARLPPRTEVFRIEVDARGRMRWNGKPAAEEGIAEALRSRRSDREGDGSRAPPSVFAEIDDRCDAGAEDRLRRLCAGAGIERFSAVRVPEGAWIGRLYRAVRLHAASLGPRESRGGRRH